MYCVILVIKNGLLSTSPQILGFKNIDNNNKELSKACEEIKNGVYHLKTLLKTIINKTFNLFKIYILKNILTVPDNLTP